MRSLVALALALTCATAARAFEVPPLTGPVVDRAGLLSPSAEQQIGDALRRLRDAGGAGKGVQIAVLTVPGLDGAPIEQASIQVVDAWQLGTASGDNGVLLMVARDDRKIRIEVGQGLEGDLPDAYARRIIDESMVPLFAAGNAEQGILVGVFQIAQRTNPDLDVESFFAGGERDWHSSRRQDRGFPALIPILFLLFLLFAGRRAGGGFLGGLLGGMVLGGLSGRSHGRSSFGGFGGGGGGGGFRGGGGGFSGGGASGGW